MSTPSIHLPLPDAAAAGPGLVVITAAAMALLVLFALTYWPWMGDMTTAG